MKSTKIINKNKRSIRVLLTKFKKQNKDLKRKTHELTELKSRLEDKNYDLIGIKKELEQKNLELQTSVTDAKLQNKDLIRKTIELTELQSRLEDNNFELQRANDEILNLMTARTEFINKAAHDLRTPITPILVLLPTIKKRIKNIGVLYDLKVIERNANYLRDIANNLITYLKSKIKDDLYHLKKTDLRMLIVGVISTYKPIFKQRKITVSYKISKKLPLIDLDELKITEVVQNIVSNAIKYMPRFGKLTVIIKKMDNFINVSFRDTGIGIKKKYLPKIFEEFFKADKSRHYAGEGLGLSICKGVIEGHNGKIWASSPGIGKGTTISFNIPLKL
jgi:signal transduction histidine kinase